MTDRIERAYQLRLTLWTWVRDHPHSSIYDLAAAMPAHLSLETLRKCIRDMREYGSIIAHGNPTRTHRFTVGKPPKTAAEARAVPAKCGHTSTARMRGKARPRTAQSSDFFQQRIPTSGPDPKRPGVYCHQCGGLDYRSQGGQGALRHQTSIQCGGLDL